MSLLIAAQHFYVGSQYFCQSVAYSWSKRMRFGELFLHTEKKKKTWFYYYLLKAVPRIFQGIEKANCY